MNLVYCVILDKLFNLLDLSLPVYKMGTVLLVRIDLDGSSEESSRGPAHSGHCIAGEAGRRGVVTVGITKIIIVVVTYPSFQCAASRYEVLGQALDRGDRGPTPCLGVDTLASTSTQLSLDVRFWME